MNVKAFINHIKKTRPVYASWLEWFEKKLANWRKTMPKITIVAPCPNCNNGCAKLTWYPWFKTPAHSWIKNIWVHHGCKDGDRRVSLNPPLDFTCSKYSMPATRNTYTAEAVNRGGIAVLPVIAGGGMEALRRPLGNSITNALIANKVRVVGWTESMVLIRDNDLVDTYQEVMGDYMDTGIIDPKDLAPIAEVLDTPFILIAKLQEVSEQKTTQYDALVGYHEISNFKVSCFCQVWNADISDVVWEGEASCTSCASYMTTERKGYDAFAKIAGKGLVDELLDWPKKWKE